MLENRQHGKIWSSEVNSKLLNPRLIERSQKHCESLGNKNNIPRHPERRTMQERSKPWNALRGKQTNRYETTPLQLGQQVKHA
eukprot:3536900-Pyramimonas_sp.AAC.2